MDTKKTVSAEEDLKQQSTELITTKVAPTKSDESESYSEKERKREVYETEQEFGKVARTLPKE